MHLSGKITIRAPRARCIAAVQQADTLAAFLPGDATVVVRDAHSFDVEFRREFGRIAVKLRGTLTVSEEVPGDVWRFVLQARHLLAGSAHMDITMRFSGTGPTTLAYDGTLTATGMAGRMITEHQDRLQPKLDEMFAGLKQRLEAERRAARA